MAHSPRTLPTQGHSPVVPDDISKQIIEQLQQDGRRSYAAIGKAVGLSEAAVRQRVQRLQDAGAAGDVQVPGTVIAFRSMLPDNQENYELRDGKSPMARPALLALAQPLGGPVHGPVQR